MSKTKVSFLIVVVATLTWVFGLGIGVFGMTLRDQISGPPKKDIEFIRACGELNGKEFSHQNIRSLSGACYVSCGKDCVGIQSCNESHISQYVEFNKSCPVAREIQDNSQPSFCEDSEFIKCSGPPLQCVDKYWNDARNGDLWISWDGSFSVSQGNLDNNWVCNIRVGKQNNTIRAVTDFSYD